MIPVLLSGASPFLWVCNAQNGCSNNTSALLCHKLETSTIAHIVSWFSFPPPSSILGIDVMFESEYYSFVWRYCAFHLCVLLGLEVCATYMYTKQ